MVKAIGILGLAGSLLVGAHAAPTVAVSAKMNGAQLATGTIVPSGSRIDYTITVANPDSPKALVLTATATYDDAGVSKTVTASSTLSVVSVVRPVITLVVPTTLTVDTPLSTTGDWPTQAASYDEPTRKVTWQGGDLIGGKVATLTFGGVAR